MPEAFIHPAAIVDSENIGAGTRVWAYAHILSGAVVGANVNVGDHAFIEGGAQIGDNVTLKNNVCVWNGIRIEDDVFIGPNVTFTNDLAPRSPRMPGAARRYATTANWLLPTHVRRGCSIGANATILPGLELGRYCFVAAGATVTRSVAPFRLVVGTPAREVGFVCRCGQRLAGCYTENSCQSCGETPMERECNR